MPGPPAVVYAVDEVITLGMMRGLHEAGIEVIGLSPSRGALGFSSRYCSRRYVCPDVIADPQAVLAFLIEHVTPGVLLPSYDPYPAFLARHQADLARAGFHLLLPAHDDLLNVVEKDRLGITAAGDPDLPVPASRILSDADIAAWDGAVPLPLILKVAHPWNKYTRLARTPTELGSRYVELVERLRRERVVGYRILAQQWVPGERILHLTQLVDREGRCLGGLAALRLRANCTVEGSERDATLLEHVDEPEMLARAARFARRHRLYGVMEFECKLDEASGRFLLLDVNPRFWAWNSFAVRCGVNYPAGYYHACLGRPWSPRPPRRRPRYHWRFFACSPYSPDLYAAFRLWRLGRQSAGALFGSYARLAWQALGHPGSVSFDFGELRDPVPRMRILLRMIGDVARTILGRRRPARERGP